MDSACSQELMASISNGRLVVICGAGLSMAAPSSAPSARDVAVLASARCRESTGTAMPVGCEADIEKLACFCYASPPLWAGFRDQYIDWKRFKGAPNLGHFAVADFLSCAAADCAITTNLDIFIEDAAERLGEPDFQAAVEGEEMTRAHDHQPLLKIHGCMHRDRDRTLWCRDQIQGARKNDAMEAQLAIWKDWLKGRLVGKDLVFVGFWSDWAHLNDILGSVLDGVQPRLVYLVDPAAPDVVQAKAPRLWSLTTGQSVIFRHVRASGAEFLDELRKILSVSFFEQLFSESIGTYHSHVGIGTAPRMRLPDSLNTDQLYDLRRDATGVTPNAVVRDKGPLRTMQTTGAIHLMVQERGATFDGVRYKRTDNSIVRVVNGAGQVMSLVQEDYSNDQPQSAAKEFVICDARSDGNAPANVIRGGRPSTILRAGNSSEWLTLEEARTRGIC
jgi:hypothetical protein